MDDDDKTISGLKAEVERLKEELDRAGEHARELEDTRTAMLFMLEDLNESTLALKNEASISKTLLMASGITSGYLNWDEVVEQILQLLHGLADSRGVSVIMLGEDGTLKPLKAAGLQDDILSFFFSLRAKVEEIPACERVIRTKQPMCITAPELRDFMPEHFSQALRLDELILVPIISRDKAEGLLAGNFERLPSDPRVLEIFKGIAGQLGVAYENTRLYEDSVKNGLELARKVETLKVLAEIDRMILSTLKREEMLSRAVFQIRRVLPADVGGVALMDQETGWLRYGMGWGLGMRKDDDIPPGTCPGYACLKSGKPHTRADIQDPGTQARTGQGPFHGSVRSDMYVPIISKGSSLGLLFLGSRRVAGFSQEDVQTAERFSNQLAVALENTKLFSDLEDTFVNIVKAMTSAIDAKSPWTKGHSERVTDYAVKAAACMGMGGVEIEKLRLAGLLHDIGKIGTYDVILDKPGKLTDEEFALVKKHPDKGCEILAPIKQFKDILPIIRGHHERMDGSGYPAGLKGDDIPLMARILCVADSFDSMTADRPYRPAPGIEFAVSEFLRCSGTQFDPAVVEAFLEILKTEMNTPGCLTGKGGV